MLKWMLSDVSILPTNLTLSNSPESRGPTMLSDLRKSLELLDQLRETLRGNINIDTRHRIDEHLDDAEYLIEVALADKEKEALGKVGLVGSLVASPAHSNGPQRVAGGGRDETNTARGIIN